MAREDKHTGWRRLDNPEDFLNAIHENMAKQQEDSRSITDLDAIADNTKEAVYMFIDRYLPWPRWEEGCEIMDVGQLRDAMGLRRSDMEGDPWPAAERALTQNGFILRSIAGTRALIVRERDDYHAPDGWNEAEEWEEEDEQEENKQQNDSTRYDI